MDDVSHNLANPWLEFSPGAYATYCTIQIAPYNVDFVRITGPSAPIYNRSITPEKQATFVFHADTKQAMFDMDPGEGTIQSGIYFEYVNFLNAGHPDNTAVMIDKTNNWRLNRCGFRGWGVGIYTEGQPDNAHGAAIDCIMDIPTHKVGVEVVGNLAWGSPAAGFAIRGGSYSGEPGSIGVYGTKWADALTIASDCKIDGCNGGAIVWYGKNLNVSQLRIEGGGSATQPMIDIRHDPSYQNSGRGNIIHGVHCIGRGNGEMYGRFSEGTFLNSVMQIYGENGANTGWVDEGHDNFVLTQSILRRPPGA